MQNRWPTSRSFNWLFVFASIFLPLTVSGADAPRVATDGIYPSKPVRLIVPFGPGGTDTIARVIASQLSEGLGRRVLVENRPGAGGTIGMEYVSRAESDGHVLLFTSPSIAIGPFFYKLSFDPSSSFSPISKTGRGPIVLTVHPSLPVKSVKELISLARRQPGALVSASSGVGSFTHMATELFKQAADVDFLVVQYKGGTINLIAIVSGDAQLGFNAITSSLPHIKSGKLKALAIGGAVSSDLLRGVPTVSQSGLPGYEASTWNGVLAPAGTPTPIIDRLRTEIAMILNSADIKKIFEAQGAEVDSLGPAEFRKFIIAETSKWERVARNIKEK